MLLTITTTHSPATDLGYLLHKHPDRLQEFALPFGAAHVFYPEATQERCTAALLLDVDPVGLIRRGVKFPRLDQYVNDRPYVASSFMSVAISRVFNTALAGRCTTRPELPEEKLPLEARLAVVPVAGGEEVARRLFEPLGYALDAVQHPLDERFPEWGASRYHTLHLRGDVRLRDLLAHLYVLIPVLDDDKHYWVGDDEVDKLLRHGDAWLDSHPERDLIVNRYLKHQRSLTRAALEQLIADEPTRTSATQPRRRRSRSRCGSTRSGTARSSPRCARAVRRACSTWAAASGKLLRALLEEPSFRRIVGVDISYAALEIAQKRLRLERLAPAQRERVELFQTALTYRDARLAGFDAAAAVEVIEHLDAARLRSFERTVFEYAQPRTVVVTTPNREYNVKFEGSPRATSATAITASSGRARSSSRGPAASPASTATACASCPSARRIPGSAHPRRWRCSRPHEAGDP